MDISGLFDNVMRKQEMHEYTMLESRLKKTDTHMEVI